MSNEGCHSTFNILHSTFIVVGLGRFELPTSRLSGVRSNQLSYRPIRSSRVGSNEISPATAAELIVRERGTREDSLKTEQEEQSISRYYDSYRPRVQTFAISF